MAYFKVAHLETKHLVGPAILKLFDSQAESQSLPEFSETCFIAILC